MGERGFEVRAARVDITLSVRDEAKLPVRP
jgi:hypothetical protein